MALQKSLLAVLREMGANFDEASWSVGGSQEIVSRCASLRGHVVTIEAETYVGLSVCGDAEIVDQLAKRTWQRCGES